MLFTVPGEILFQELSLQLATDRGTLRAGEVGHEKAPSRAEGITNQGYGGSFLCQKLIYCP